MSAKHFISNDDNDHVIACYTRCQRSFSRKKAAVSRNIFVHQNACEKTAISSRNRHDILL